ncbi:echinoderm microtubule-associated protein-like 2 isoform X1 [Canis lupus baileyi]|uniref:EMAP like 2 n=2 Tax=Canis lupus familiaris TaxID=9615 RepID=A0A8C0RBX1_CANLF|nr:echinoderm microtubule-associated protein-like 2 isoform X1 [Canis lupus familiaris]XP_038384489.1 echinoderm microtubule-associated protein-like 2 isoform X1 [Canis lupus familiaris]XP_038512570.1 echinoderm microtubule-associated protein-like 2 isoform X1 [Canis lupus familiaris]|eukprot:XP_003432617.1 echinoderm microtubule-associated protein-like 2 isoform X1 [Canis lupus familiaris]
MLERRALLWQREAGPGGGDRAQAGAGGAGGGCGGAMAERGPAFCGLYDTSSLLQYCNDDNLSGTSGMEVDDRVSALEQRLQLQEDELAVLKAALADALRRLRACEEQGAALRARGTPKGRAPPRLGTTASVCQLLKGLPTRTPLNGAGPPRRVGGYATSPSSPKKEASSGRSARRYLSPERLASVRREDPRSRTTSSSSNCSAKKEGKTKEVIFSLEEGSVKMFLRGRPVPMLIPDEMAPTYSLDTRSELPPSRLKLDWVYGYRGRDCRANLYLLPTGEIVYFVASVAVLYSVEEQRQRHYLGHNDDIKCLAVHPDMVTIATGQVAGTTKEGKPLPPHVRIWDSVSLSTLHVLGLGVFDRAVCCVGFSKSNGGNLLCAVDESNDHMLSVWDWAKEAKVVDGKCSNEAVLVATFHPTDPTLLITCGKSHIYFWSLEGGSLSKRQGLFEKHEKPKYVLCVTFLEGGDVVTGDSGGNLYVWGKGGNRITQAVLGAHDGGVFGLCALRDGTLVSGGGRDRRVVLWGSDYSKLQEVEVPEDFGPVRTVAEGRGDTLYVGTTRNSILQGSVHTGFSLLVQGHVEELWGLATHPSRAQFVTCGQDKLVHLWSAESHQPLWSRIIEDPARSAGFHPSGSVLAVGTVTGRWLLLDTETHDLVAIHTDGNEQISVVSFSPDGAYLTVGSHDNLVYVYTVDQGGRKVSRLGKCSGHSSFITHLDWAQDSSCFVTNSGDYEILYWDPATCKQITSADAVRNVEWATATCVLGFGVFGIWSEGADGTDINAVARSHDGKLLASADDFGKVHLFSYPCCQPRALSHKYGGHSSHVTNVAFLWDDSMALTTGGKDTSVLQWRVV